MADDDPRGDDELLRSARVDPDAFAVLYRRHVHALLGYFYRRTGDAELAADLTAETFAAALDGAHRFRPERGPAIAWLYGIARRLLGHALRRGAVEDRARRRLGMSPLTLTDEGLERVEAIAAADATAHSLQVAFDALPADQRSAIQARVLDGRDYEEIARGARTSASVIRQRVSRGLAGLRSQIKEDGT
jgi:RNA polymerase sigma-70 factor (ECF subfamily)